jgi:hypothetical protein
VSHLVVVSVSYLAGSLEDSDDLYGVGPMGTQESVFRNGFIDHPWIKNLVAGRPAGKWINNNSQSTRSLFHSHLGLSSVIALLLLRAALSLLSLSGAHVDQPFVVCPSLLSRRMLTVSECATRNVVSVSRRKHAGAPSKQRAPRTPRPRPWLRKETMRTGHAIYKYREGLGGTKKQQEGRKLDTSGLSGSSNPGPVWPKFPFAPAVITEIVFLPNFRTGGLSPP